MDMGRLGGGGGSSQMIFFRIKDNIILAKSVLIEEKALHLRRFFANKVKNGRLILRCPMKHLQGDWPK